MKLGKWLIAVMLGAGLTGAAPGQEPTTPPLRPEPAKLSRGRAAIPRNTPASVERANRAVSVKQLEYASDRVDEPLLRPIQLPIAEEPRGRARMVDAGDWSLRTNTDTERLPQVEATPLPSFSDGLDGNRTIALSPFPNLNLNSGPLGKEQLPWYHHMPSDSPYTFLRTAEFATTGGLFRSSGPVNDRAWGIYNTFSFAFPFWTERSVGIQAGFICEPTTFPQVFLGGTVGYFHQAIWTLEENEFPRFVDRVSWGAVYDGLYDSELRIYIGQARGQLGFALSPSREMGVWASLKMQDAISQPGRVLNNPLLVSPVDQVQLYYRQTFRNELDVTVFSGWVDSPGGMDFGVYLSYRFTNSASLVSQGMFNFEKYGAMALYTGIELHLSPMESYSLLSGNPQNRYRPYVRTLDHINFQQLKRLP